MKKKPDALLSAGLLYCFDIVLRNNLTEIRRGGYTILFRKIK